MLLLSWALAAPAMADVDFSEKHLDVPLHGQMTDLWCWATSAEMILRYMNNHVTQCSQATQEYGIDAKVDCCAPQALTSDLGSQHCVQGGWPPFEQWGFSSKNTADACEPRDHCALSFDQLKGEIDADRPVAFSWRYSGGGGHMMVAIGYVELGEEQWVLINNPWPPGNGDTALITYDYYVSGPYQHWRDYYEIQPATADTKEGD